MRGERRTLSAAERIAWLRLIRSENVGPTTFAALIEQYGDAQRALDALPELARRGGRRSGLKLCSLRQAEGELAAAEKAGARYLAAIEPAYPRALAAVDPPPPLICVKGNIHLLERPSVGIVGARNASAAGARMARALAAGLGRHGLVVTSGMARGIDAAAHQGALETGTCAVLGGGIDVIYPPENEELYARLSAEGVLVSEMPPGTRPQARHFPQRNRLISGISLGVVVVEAAMRSGSLITARFALEQGREVFAVPGSPADPRCRGANDLIRQGATLVESADDVMRVLADMLNKPFEEPAGMIAAGPPPVTPDDNALPDARRRLLELLGPTPVEIDELTRQSGLTLPLVRTVLLELELAGRLDRHAGQRVALVTVEQDAS